MTRPPVEAWADGSAFFVKAHPGARRDGFSGLHDGMVKIDVTAAPEKGKANKAILKFLSKRLDLPLAGLELLSGDAGQKKRIGVHHVSPGQLADMLEKML
jgi:Uncharacterized conserved protein